MARPAAMNTDTKPSPVVFTSRATSWGVVNTGRGLLLMLANHVAAVDAMGSADGCRRAILFQPQVR